MSTTTYLAHPPYVAEATHLRVMLTQQDGLELVSLDTGAYRKLISPSDDNGDYWFVESVQGGVIAHGAFGGNGSGTTKLNVWFIPNGQAPVARRLGRATHSLDEPSGGIWLFDIPDKEGNPGGGTATLVDTQGRRLRTRTIRCCQTPVASVGRDRFITETIDKQGVFGLNLYDAPSKKTIRRLAPRGSDPSFERATTDSVVWTDTFCHQDCVEHVVDLATGATREQPATYGVVSPDGNHTAEAARSGVTALTVDGQAVGNADDAIRGLHWAPDSAWLLFVRPDVRHFGIWRVGAAQAETVNRDFGYLEEWAIFDQRG